MYIIRLLTNRNSSSKLYCSNILVIATTSALVVIKSNLNVGQLTDLIKNKARALGLDAQLLLKKYFMEQMLARIAKSEYKTNFILKGGLLISSLIGLSSRTTQDIDVSIVNKPLSIEEIERVMTNVCKIDLNDNIKYELTNVQEIREEFEYPF